MGVWLDSFDFAVGAGVSSAALEEEPYGGVLLDYGSHTGHCQDKLSAKDTTTWEAAVECVCVYVYIYRIIYICTLHDESCCPACFQLFTAFHQPPWFRCSTTQVVHLEAIESINSCVLEHLQDDFAVIKPFKRRISVEI